MRYQRLIPRLIPRFIPRLILFVLFFALASQPGLARDSGKTGILLVAFGTSVPEAQSAFKNIDAEYKKAFPDSPVVWAFTSRIIRKKLARAGMPVGSISEGLDRLAKDGVKTVRIQSLHVMAGEEFAELARAALLNVQKHPGRFSAVYLGRPLLESAADAAKVSRAVLDVYKKERGPKDALILMGHGHKDGRADLVFEGARSIFSSQDPLVFMATVEGSRDFDDLAADLKKHNVQKVWLAPFMIVAGDHARNDLGGQEEDSWASKLKALGYDTRVNLQGLGDIAPIGEIFVDHTKKTEDDLVKEPVKP